MGISRFLKQIRDKDWVGENLDQQLFREGNKNGLNSPPVLSIRPSSSGGNCSRAIQFSMLGFREKMKPQNLRRTRNGTAAHDRWNDEFEASGILVAKNVRLKVEEIGWSGECDVIVKNPLTNESFILEIKTMNAFRYKSLPEQTEDLEQMARMFAIQERSYMYQLAQYIKIFKDTEYKTSDVGIFLFENTDTQEYKIRYVKPDTKLMNDLFALPMVAREYSKRGELIEPPFVRTSKQCRACYKESLCYRVQDKDPETLKAVEYALDMVKD